MNLNPLVKSQDYQDYMDVKNRLYRQEKMAKKLIKSHSSTKNRENDKLKRFYFDQVINDSIQDQIQRTGSIDKIALNNIAHHIGQGKDEQDLQDIIINLKKKRNVKKDLDKGRKDKNLIGGRKEFEDLKKQVIDSELNIKASKDRLDKLS